MGGEPTTRALGDFKQELLDRLLRVVSVLGIGASLWALLASHMPFKRSLIVVALFSPVHVFAWVPGLAHRVRAIGLTASLTVTAVFISLTAGPSFGAGICCATVCVLGGLLHGRKVGLALYAALGALLMVGGIAMQAGLLPRPIFADPRHIAVWVTAGVNFFVIVGMMLASMLFVVERIERALHEERATLRRLEDERRERLRAEEALAAAEEALRRAQMVEAAGKLAGGVAHDFNNSLMVIHGWVDLLRAGTLRGDEVTEALDSVTRAVISCSQLTTRLLTLGRRDVRKPVLLDPREVLENERRSLRAIMPENIDITIDVAWPEPIHADPSQLQQVLLNLCLNARDAMPSGGRLEIRVLPEEDSAAERPGTIIEVKDSGPGMEPEVQAHLFEPFFTTKGDRGTGLGLAMVQSVMRQSGGHVSVDTMLGYGTSVRLRFPPADPGLRRAPLEAPPAKGPSVNVLVVEDEAEVRAVIVRTLRKEGHYVVEAGDVGSGLLALAAHAGKLELLVTDGIMPGRPVAELVEGFRQAHPEGKVLVCSGYLEDVSVKEVVERGAAAFMSKPVRAHELARAVAELLGGPEGRPQLARAVEFAE